MPGGQGVVISDRTGQLQAFRHAGELNGSELVSRLQRYADGSRVVTTTDTLTSGRTSFYGPQDGISGPGLVGGYPQGYGVPGVYGQQGYGVPGVYGQQGYGYPGFYGQPDYGNYGSSGQQGTRNSGGRRGRRNR